MQKDRSQTPGSVARYHYQIRLTNLRLVWPTMIIQVARLQLAKMLRVWWPKNFCVSGEERTEQCECVQCAVSTAHPDVMANIGR